MATVGQIPNTNYQIQNGSILSPDGNQVSPEQFVQKVMNKEISLTADSLRFLGEQLGPDLKNSLIALSGSQTPAPQLLGKLESTENLTPSIVDLMVLLTKIVQDTEKNARESKQGQFALQIGELKQSAEDQRVAATWRMVAGITSGVATMGSGALNMAGASKTFGMSTEQLNQGLGTAMNQRWSGYGSLSQGGGQILSSVFEKVGSEYDAKAKQDDINAKKFEQGASDAKDLQDSMRDMGSKVRDLLRDLTNSEKEISQTIIRNF